MAFNVRNLMRREERIYEGKDCLGMQALSHSPICFVLRFNLFFSFQWKSAYWPCANIFPDIFNLSVEKNPYLAKNFSLSNISLFLISNCKVYPINIFITNRKSQIKHILIWLYFRLKVSFKFVGFIKIPWIHQFY